MTIHGTVGVGAFVLNEYVLEMTEIEGGHRLTATKGTQSQSIDILDGKNMNAPYEDSTRDLKAIYGGADGLHAVLTDHDLKNMRDLDCYPVRFSGAYRDFSRYILPEGSIYYTDHTCTTEAGTAASDIPVTKSAFTPAAYVFSIDENTYYARVTDLARHTVKTIDKTLHLEANINAYHNYGDIAPDKDHICFAARETALDTRINAHELQWADAVEDSYTGDGVTRVFAPSSESLVYVRYVCVNGALKTKNTDYTVSGGTVTFTNGNTPENGAWIVISRTSHDCFYKGSALYKTFNDPEYGLINTIDDADFKARLINTRERFENEPWSDRGLLFIPSQHDVSGGLISISRAVQKNKRHAYFLSGASKIISEYGTLDDNPADSEAGVVICTVFA